MAKTNEIFPDDRQDAPIPIPTYGYGQNQEGLDVGRMRNLGWGNREELVNDAVYFAKRSGIVKAQATASASITITGYSDSNETPTTIMDQQGFSLGGGETASPSITFPVNAGHYYKVSSASGIVFAYFISIAK